MDNKRKRSSLDDDSDNRIRKIAKKYTITITEDMSDASSTDGRAPQARPNIPRRGRADSSEGDISSSQNQDVLQINGHPVTVDIYFVNHLGEARAPGSEKSGSEEEDEEDDECVELLRLTHKVDNKRKRSFLEDDSDKCNRKIAKKYTMTITEDMSDASSTDGRAPQAVSCERPEIPRRGHADSSEGDISSSHNQEVLPINGHPVNMDISYGNSLGEDREQGSKKSSSEEEAEEDDECVELLRIIHYDREQGSEKPSSEEEAEEDDEFVELLRIIHYVRAQGSEKSGSEEEDEEDDECVELLRIIHYDREQGSEKSSSEKEAEENDECVELLCLTHNVRGIFVKRSSGYYPLHRSSCSTQYIAVLPAENPEI